MLHGYASMSAITRQRESPDSRKSFTVRGRYGPVKSVVRIGEALRAGAIVFVGARSCQAALSSPRQSATCLGLFAGVTSLVDNLAPLRCGRFVRGRGERGCIQASGCLARVLLTSEVARAGNEFRRETHAQKGHIR